MAHHVRLDPDGVYHTYPGEYERDDSVIPLDERRMIVIPAVPSSGTSCVAGILHHLGVNMGNVNNRVTTKHTKQRGYEQYEDVDTAMFTSEVNGLIDHLINQKIRFLHYLNYRYLLNPEGRLGVKTLPTIWMHTNHPEAWPIDILDVRRPLGMVLERDAERLARSPERTGAEPPPAFQVMNRYAGVAAMHWARERLIQIHPPKLTVPYEELLEDAPTWIERIVKVFELEVNDRQMTTALLSVRR